MNGKVFPILIIKEIKNRYHDIYNYYQNLPFFSFSWDMAVFSYVFDMPLSSTFSNSCWYWRRGYPSVENKKTQTKKMS